MKYLVAIALLTGDPELTEGLPGPDQWAELSATVQELAVEWELMGANETKYLFARLDDFATDLVTLRTRYADLKDAPRVGCSLQYPPAEVVNEWLRFNRGYRVWLTLNQCMYPELHGAIQQAIAETDACYLIWDNVRDSRLEWYNVAVRRAALKRIPAVLPDPLPFWRFTE